MRVNMVLMLVTTVKMVLLVRTYRVRLCLLCLLMFFDALYACCCEFLRLLNMDMLRVMTVDMVPLCVCIVYYDSGYDDCCDCLM